MRIFEKRNIIVHRDIDVKHLEESHVRTMSVPSLISMHEMPTLVIKDSHTLKICDFIFICLLVDHEPDSPDHLRTLKRPVSFNGITIGDVEMAKVRGTVNE